MSSILPSVRSISGAALQAALDTIATLARWRDALPNDPDVIRDAAAKAVATLELIREAPTAAAARSFSAKALSEEEILALYAARLAWFKARTIAWARAYDIYGPDAGKLPGVRVYVTVPRELRYSYNRFTKKVRLDPPVQIMPALVYWRDGELPDGIVVGEPVPTFYNPSIERLLKEGEIWSRGQWAKEFPNAGQYLAWRSKFPDHYRDLSPPK
jgi:hypothetical protein